jgi:hypothetical protein
MLSNALHSYSSKYHHDIRNKDCYIHWLENDILLELNDDKAMMNGIQPNLQRVFPNMSCHEIVKRLNQNKTESQIMSSIEHLWGFLPLQGKEIIVAKHAL